jgi:hypothetical protein
MPYTCFSFPAEMPPGAGNRDTARAALGDVRRMPFPCFSYPAETLIGNGGTAQPEPDGLRSMPNVVCFRY